MRTITDHICNVPVVRAPQKPRSRGFWPATQGSLLPCAAAARRPRLPFPMLFIASRVAMGRCGCPAAAGRRPTAALRCRAGRGRAGLEARGWLERTCTTQDAHRGIPLRKKGRACVVCSFVIACSTQQGKMLKWHRVRSRSVHTSGVQCAVHVDRGTPALRYGTWFK